MQYFIKTQTPTVEIKVSAFDGGGNKDSCIFGFKRPSSPKESEALDKEYKALIDSLNPEASITEVPELIEFVSNRVLYIKNYQLVDGEGKPGPTITDTRTINNEKFFKLVYGSDENNPAREEAINEGTLKWLLQLFFNSTPWWGAIINGMLRSFLNVDYEAASKNS